MESVYLAQMDCTDFRPMFQKLKKSDLKAVLGVFGYEEFNAAKIKIQNCTVLS